MNWGRATIEQVETLIVGGGQTRDERVPQQARPLLPKVSRDFQLAEKMLHFTRCPPEH
jgi:hypothetical protein